MTTPDDSFSLTSGPDHHSHTAALDAALFADSSSTTTYLHNHNHQHHHIVSGGVGVGGGGTSERQLSWMTSSSTGTLPTTTTTTNTGVTTKDETVQIFRCTYDDCLREFQRKTSLTNHLKAHKNKNSRSILRSKRMKRNAQRAEEDRRRKLSLNVDALHELGNVISPLHAIAHNSNSIHHPHSHHQQATSTRRVRSATLGAGTSGIDLMPCTSPVSGNGQNMIEPGPSNGQIGISSPNSICNTPPMLPPTHHQQQPSSSSSLPTTTTTTTQPPPRMPNIPTYTPQPPTAIPSLIPNDWAPPRIVHSLSDYMVRDPDGGISAPFSMPLPFSAQHELGMPTLVDELAPLQTTGNSNNAQIDGYDLTPFLLEPPLNSGGPIDANRRTGGGGGVFE